MHKVILVAACCSVAVVSAAHARQSAPAALDPARRAIELSLPDGGGSSIGIWWVRSPETQLGLTVAGSYSSHDSSQGAAVTAWGLAAGPAIKRHVLVSGAVVPHLRGSLLAGYSGTNATPRPRAFNVTAAGAFGVDWFPVDRVGIGAHTGLQTGFARNSADVAGTRMSGTAWNIRTFTSGLTLHLYF